MEKERIRNRENMEQKEYRTENMNREFKKKEKPSS